MWSAVGSSRCSVELRDPHTVTVRADLHLHSCLSPCGDLDNSPSAIARIARARGADLVALTDHNSARNCPAFAAAAKREGLSAIFGLEATSREEVDLLCLFERVDTALGFGRMMEDSLPDFPNDPSRFGEQLVVDEAESILEEVDVHLLSASRLTLDEIVDACHSAGGIAIAAHIDRAHHGLIAQLGFVPDIGLDAVERVRDARSPGAVTSPSVGGPDGAIVANSDAHFPQDICRRWTAFEMARADFGGLVAALARLRSGDAGAARPSFGGGFAG